MFDSKIQLGSIDVTLENFSVNGKISIGLSINSQILSKFEPLLEKAIRFESNKLFGKQRIQKELDELGLMELELRKARVQKELEQLRK